MSYDATNNLDDFDETLPLGSTDAGELDEILRETRRVIKTMLQFVIEANGAIKNDVINTQQLLDNTITAAKLNDSAAGAGLVRNATTKALDLLFDSDVFTLDGNGELTIKAGTDLSAFISNIADASIASVSASKLLYSGPAAEFLLSNGTGGFTPRKLTGGISVSPTGVVTINTGIANVIIHETKGSNTGAGGLTAATWSARDSLVKQLDPSNLAVVSGDEFTLKPGFTYLFDIRVPAYGVGGHIARLWNETSGQVVANGTSSYTGLSVDSDEHVGYSEIQTAVAVTGADPVAFKVQSNCNTTNANANSRGRPANVGSLAEIYTRVLIFILESEETE